MASFREALEAIKSKKISDVDQSDARKFLQEVLNRLKVMNGFDFRQIETINFSCEENKFIYVKINQKDLLLIDSYAEYRVKKVFDAIRDIIKKDYPNDVVDVDKYSFYLKF